MLWASLFAMISRKRDSKQADFVGIVLRNRGHANFRANFPTLDHVRGREVTDVCGKDNGVKVMVWQGNLSDPDICGDVRYMSIIRD